MYRTFNKNYNKEMMVLMPGEHYISSDQVISTILGTCVSVVLYSPKDKIGGMNHFMLPFKIANQSKSIFDSIPGRYGINAMEILINDFIKAGIKKENLLAKVFGGGVMLDITDTKSSNIGQKNIDFIKIFLKNEKIKTMAEDMGGVGGRKIILTPWDGKVLVKKMGKMKSALENENRYKASLKFEQSHKKVFF